MSNKSNFSFIRAIFFVVALVGMFPVFVFPVEVQSPWFIMEVGTGEVSYIYDATKKSMKINLWNPSMGHCCYWENSNPKFYNEIRQAVATALSGQYKLVIYWDDTDPERKISRITIARY